MYLHVYTCTTGCHFVGGRLDVGRHKETCSFNDESQLIAVTMKEVLSCIFLLE